MSKGKYSPTLNSSHGRGGYNYNAQGYVPEVYALPYNQETMFPNYDCDGYDNYGYSAYDRDGEYVGFDGVDRAGKTEMDYLTDDGLSD